jgi:hypothetical protein
MLNSERRSSLAPFAEQDMPASFVSGERLKSRTYACTQANLKMASLMAPQRHDKNFETAAFHFGLKPKRSSMIMLQMSEREKGRP